MDWALCAEHYLISLVHWRIAENHHVADVGASDGDRPKFLGTAAVDLQCEWICMHAEVLDGLAFRLIDQIHDAGLKAGIVLNPETPMWNDFPYIELVDKITIMTIDPGFAANALLKAPR